MHIADHKLNLSDEGRINISPALLKRLLHKTPMFNIIVRTPICEPVKQVTSEQLRLFLLQLLCNCTQINLYLHKLRHST